MDKNGRESIQHALQEVDIAATVSPLLKGDEAAQFVTIESNHHRILPEKILNALSRAGFMDSKSLVDGYPSGKPSLKSLGVAPESITFEDLNYSSTNTDLFFEG